VGGDGGQGRGGGFIMGGGVVSKKLGSKKLGIYLARNHITPPLQANQNFSSSLPTYVGIVRVHF
jgi:hypothetical protein